MNIPKVIDLYELTTYTLQPQERFLPTRAVSRYRVRRWETFNDMKGVFFCKDKEQKHRSVFDLIFPTYISNFITWALANSHMAKVLSGSIPVFDTMHGIRAEVNIVVKVDPFSDVNKFRQNSCGIPFFHCVGVLNPKSTYIILISFIRILATALVLIKLCYLIGKYFTFLRFLLPIMSYYYEFCLLISNGDWESFLLLMDEILNSKDLANLNALEHRKTFKY
uniref:Uncharacterized protein n=1 Tax=Glossina palpalis gambiensis TaxID=67801 RepID=A0A1B0BXN8_9MUSC